MSRKYKFADNDRLCFISHYECPHHNPIEAGFVDKEEECYLVVGEIFMIEKG